MVDMKRSSRTLPAICAILGFVLITACDSNSSGAAQARSPAYSPTNSPAIGPASSASPASGPVPGVIDCGESDSSLYIRPASILIACGDGTSGVGKITWVTWGMFTATGKGYVYADQCVPSCASGKEVITPAQVMLSGVKTSPQGYYFSELTVTWEGRKPPDAEGLPFHVSGSPTSPQDSYALTPPQAPRGLPTSAIQY